MSRRPPEILILCDRVDPHVDTVLHHLQRLGRAVVRYHPSDVHLGYPVAADLSEQHNRAWFGTPGPHHLHLEELRAVYNRGWSKPRPHPRSAHSNTSDWCVSESTTAFFDLLGCLDDRPWMTHPSLVRAASRKARQLRIAHDVGLATPRSLWSCDPEQILAFAESVGGTVLIKPSEWIEYTAGGKRRGVWVSKIDLAQLAQSRTLLTTHFAFYQQPIEKVADLRCYVIGTDVFACEMTPRSGHYRAVDHRASLEQMDYAATRLPDDISAQLVQVCARLGVAYAAIDLVRTPANELYFLEANINGQWLWIEQAAGLPLSARIARQLDRLASEA